MEGNIISFRVLLDSSGKLNKNAQLHIGEDTDIFYL